MINGGTVDRIRGGHAPTTEGNSVTINDGDIANPANIEDDTTENVIGGFATKFNDHEGDLYSANNSVNIYGGKIYGDVYGGYAGVFKPEDEDSDYTGSAVDNIINIYGSPDLASANLYGGHGTTIYGNTLNIYTKDLTAQNVYNFDAVNFYLDSSINSGDTMLTLTDSEGTDVTNSDISAVMEGGSSLTYGDTVTLLTNENGITEAKAYTGTITEGVSVEYTITVKRSDDGNSIIAQLGDPEPPIESPTEPPTESEIPVVPVPTPTYPSNVSNNIITVTDSSYTINGQSTSHDGKFNRVFGGRVAPENNPAERDLIGGYLESGDAVNNTMTIEGGEYTSAVYGGYSESGSASNNTLNINDGTFRGDIIGGYGLTANGNVINIHNNPDLTSANIYVGQMFGGVSADLVSSADEILEAGSDNTLNIYSKNITAQNVGYLTNLNFYIPSDAVNGDTMLTLTDSAGTDLSGVAVKAGVVAGNSNLNSGDTLTLVTNSNGITTGGTTYSTLTEGVSLNYDLTVSKFGGNSIIATVNDVNNGRLLDQTKIIPESITSSPMLIQNSFDTLETWLPPIDYDIEDKDESQNDITDVPLVETRGFEVFANMGGGSIRTKTGNGSYVDMKSHNFDLGFARSLESSSGRLTFAPIIDYARGSYDSYLADGTHGNGSTRYIAGGLIGRKSLKNGFYVESSLRGGKVKTDFLSDNLDLRYKFSKQRQTSLRLSLDDAHEQNQPYLYRSCLPIRPQLRHHGNIQRL